MGISLSKAFEKDKAKSGAKSNSDFNYNNNHSFYRFYKGYDEFAEISLDSKYNRMKEFMKFLTNFENLGPKKPESKLKKEQIIKNVDEPCQKKKYYDAYESDYDPDDELNKAKKKKNWLQTVWVGW